MNTHRVSQDLVDTVPAGIDPRDAYPIGCPTHLKPRPLGLDKQGRYPEAAHAASEFDEDEDEGLRLGLGAFLPVFLALSLVGACAALVLMLKDFAQ